MNTAQTKTMWWCLFAMALGGTLLFAALVAERGSPTGREKFLWLWPISTALVSLIAPFRLRALYREEPFQGPGLWQLSMTDLLATAFFVGLNLSCWQWAGANIFLFVGIPASLISGGAFVLGLLVATRTNLKGALRRWLFSAGYVARTYGALSVGSLMVLMFVGLFFRASPWEIFHDIWFDNGRFGAGWIGNLFRSGQICLPLGWIACKAVKPKALESTPCPPDTPL